MTKKHKEFVESVLVDRIEWGMSKGLNPQILVDFHLTNGTVVGGHGNTELSAYFHAVINYQRHLEWVFPEEIR